MKVLKNSSGKVFYTSGEAITPPEPTLQSKIVTPTTTQQSITSDSGYDGLSSVTVNAISTEEKVAITNGIITPSSGYLLSSVVVSIPVYNGEVS